MCQHSLTGGASHPSGITVCGVDAGEAGVQCVPSSQLSITVLLDVLLPLGQHVIEWIMTYALSERNDDH